MAQDQRGLDHQHIPLQDLRCVMAGVADKDSLFRTVTHLSNQCSSCWSLVDELGSGPLPKVQIDEPVGSALRRVVEVRLCQESGLLEELPDPLFLLLARHRHLAFTARNRPLGFAELIFEEARAGLLTDPFVAVPKIHRAAKLVLHFLSLLSPSATPLVNRDLQAQVSILRADAFRVFATVARDPVQVRESSESTSRHLIQARRFAAQGTGSAELEAMLFLAEAQSTRRRGSKSTLKKAGWLLRRAAKKLLMVEGPTPLISARRSELMMELAAVQGESTAWKAARKTSIEALRLLDDFSPPFVRITLVRHLACAEAKLHLLGTSNKFISASQMPCVRQHLSFFHSRLYGRTTRVETPAFRSFARSLAKLGFGHSAVPILVLLGRLYALEGYQPALTELATELVDLCDAEEMALLVRSELRFLGPHITSTSIADHLRK